MNRRAIHTINQWFFKAAELAAWAGLTVAVIRIFAS